MKQEWIIIKSPLNREHKTNITQRWDYCWLGVNTGCILYIVYCVINGNSCILFGRFFFFLSWHCIPQFFDHWDCVKVGRDKRLHEILLQKLLVVKVSNFNFASSNQGKRLLPVAKYKLKITIEKNMMFIEKSCYFFQIPKFF